MLYARTLKKALSDLLVSLARWFRPVEFGSLEFGLLELGSEQLVLGECGASEAIRN